MKLSPTQQAALEKMRAEGGRLYRWRGGYWSTRRPPAVPTASRPVDHVGTRTVLALVDRGVAFVFAINAAGGYPVEVALTPENP